MNVRAKLLPHQYEALAAENRIVCMSMGVASGKTATVALVAIVSMLKGKRILVVEPTYAQIRDPFMREVEKQMARYGLIPEGAKVWNLNSKNLRFMSGEILARSAEGGKSAYAGLDGIDTLIIDEASEIEDYEIFTEGCNRQRKTKFPKEKKTYVVGTGASGEHWFKQIANDPKNLLINANYHQNYFLDSEDIADYESLYGSETIFPQSYIDQYVHGRFVDNSSDSIFQELKIDAAPQPGIKVAGYDVAYSGKGDDSAIAILNGNILEHVYVRKTAGDTQMKAFQDEIDLLHKPDYWNYDSTGNPVVLKGAPVNFSFSGGQFANMRTKIYFDLKRRLKDGIHVSQKVLCEHWTKIKEELGYTTLNMDKETKKPALADKQSIKKMLRRSPDRADALALACIPAAQSVDYNAIARRNNPYRQGRLV